MCVRLVVETWEEDGGGRKARGRGVERSNVGWREKRARRTVGAFGSWDPSRFRSERPTFEQRARSNFCHTFLFTLPVMVTAVATSVADGNFKRDSSP
jgi:hypothetical protein